MNRNTFKSIGAVFAGFLTVVILSVGTDALLGLTGFFPSVATGALLLAFAYRSVYTVAGGYVTARLAPINPSRHVNILGILGTCGGIIGVIAGWDLSAHWYPIALAITAFPLVYVGGRVWGMRGQVFFLIHKALSK